MLQIHVKGSKAYFITDFIYLLIYLFILKISIAIEADGINIHSMDFRFQHLNQIYGVNIFIEFYIQ